MVDNAPVMHADDRPSLRASRLVRKPLRSPSNKARSTALNRKDSSSTSTTTTIHTTPSEVFHDIPRSKKTTPMKMATPTIQPTKTPFESPRNDNPFLALIDSCDKWLQQNSMESIDDLSIITLDTTGTGSEDDATKADTPPRINTSTNAQNGRRRKQQNKKKRSNQIPAIIEPTSLPIPPVLYNSSDTPVAWEVTHPSTTKLSTSKRQRKKQRPTKNVAVYAKVDSTQAITTTNLLITDLTDDTAWPALSKGSGVKLCDSKAIPQPSDIPSAALSIPDTATWSHNSDDYVNLCYDTKCSTLLIVTDARTNNSSSDNTTDDATNKQEAATTAYDNTNLLPGCGTNSVSCSSWNLLRRHRHPYRINDHQSRNCFCDSFTT
ncbi:hypothetical protein SEMRO_3258_G345930.1 [Seminavis robusta]|uniref:Uncharacterized protein n=1 Tax=Seminavis robusta TaxID=568900 RepID=A0A9N8F342_9STRA|nr:hypothetical protein SEMRO_3258_G345930.1 [Seminavis robusta]|eukprot:Sro3258_g345930.1 n/a (378) ;mRNA; r:1020-2314